MNNMTLQDLVERHNKTWRTFRNWLLSRHGTDRMAMLDDLANRKFWMDDRRTIHTSLLNGSEHLYCDPDWEWQIVK